MARQRVAATAAASMGRFTALLRTAPDGDAMAVGQWRVRDVAAHLAAGTEMYIGILRGDGSAVAAVDGLAAYNAKAVAANDEPDLAVLADRIDAAMEQALATAGEGDGTTLVPWHGGVTLPLSALWAAVAAEGLVHGYDVARAASRPWPLPGDEVRTTLTGLLPLSVHMIDPKEAAGLDACVELRLRGGDSPRALLIFEDGRLTFEPPRDRRVDCHVSADPAAYLLVAYGRQGPTRAALTGKVVAWGRKPFLAFRLNRVFRKP